MSRPGYKIAEHEKASLSRRLQQIGQEAIAEDHSEEAQATNWLWTKGAPVFISKSSLKQSAPTGVENAPRKRGRPRKHPIEAPPGTETEASAGTLAAGVLVPRKRGRPRKIRPEDGAVLAPLGAGALAGPEQAQPPRKRGRPRKNPLAATPTTPAAPAQRTFIVSALAASGADTKDRGAPPAAPSTPAGLFGTENLRPTEARSPGSVLGFLTSQRGPAQADVLPVKGPRQPVHATRDAVMAGKISRVWNARLNKPDYGLSYSWESYLALQNKAVLDLQISPGVATAIVDYKGEAEVTIKVSPIADMRWRDLVSKCGLSCESWVTLLAGNITFEDIRKFYVDSDGLIPSGDEVRTHCTCPMSMEHGCVHATTALYALGAWFQDHPLDLLTLRSANREVLFARSRLLRGEDRVGIQGYTDRRLVELFGISES